MRIHSLLSSGIALFDGGFGSLMAGRGLSFDCTERLNLAHPDDVRAAHRAYVEAGAHVIETNTLGANPIRLRGHGLANDAARITEAAVGHARAAGAPVIACSMGTTAEFLAPTGTLSLDEAVDCFAVQAQAAAGAGADLLFTETLTDLAEARAMWMAAKAAGLPFGASFTFLENGRTLTGSTPEVCSLTAQAMGAMLVGVNCVGDPSLILSIAEKMRAVCPLPVVVQPNAGLPQEVDGALRYLVTPEALLCTMEKAVSLGAGAIGGCCGTTPDHIRAMAGLVKDKPAPTPGGDGLARICGPRGHLTLSEALASHEIMTPAEIDVTDARAVLLDLRGLSPSEAAEAMDEALLTLKQPLIFRADHPETLQAALRVYPGVAAVDAPFDVGYGAIRV